MKALLVLSVCCWTGLQSVNAQCNPPGGFSVTNITDETATLNWTTNTPPPTDHCWTIEVGGVGFTCGTGTQVFETTVCQGDADLTVSGNNLSYTVTGLQEGTAYDWSIMETCDGLAPPNNISGPCASTGATFTTLDDPFTVAPGTIVAPSCPLVSPGFTPDGFFEVVVTDGSSCPEGVYNVVVTAGPYVTAPVAYLGVQANGNSPGSATFSFFFAGPGVYTVTVTELGSCNPLTNPVAINVTVPDGTDVIAPVFTVSDVLANPIADNDGGTGTPQNAILSDVTLPEGECGYQETVYVQGADNCDGGIVAAGAVTASATTSPGTVFPGTQITSIIDDGSGFYAVEIFWSVGLSVVTINMTDAAGNVGSITLQRDIDDNVNPSITIVGANNNVIPACATSRDITVTVYIDDYCDQWTNPSDLSVSFNGTEVLTYSDRSDDAAFFEYTVTITAADDGSTWSATYTDDFGNPATAQVTASVVQATEDLPPLIIAANENILIPVCESSTFISYSFQIMDDCDDINPAAVTFDGGGSGLSITFTDVDNNNNSAYFEATGIITNASAVYFLTISYGGTTLNPAIDVQTQADQGAVIIMPGNLHWTLPVCVNSVVTTFAIQIHDDCDDALAILAGAQFFLDGAPITPTFTNAANDGSVYFEFTETLTAANNGSLILATYTDGGGQFTAVDALLSITDQPDNWAPIIVYPSQDINVELDPCDEGPAVIFFEVTATDNCAGDVTPTVTGGPGLVILPPFGSPGGDTYVALAGPGVYQVLIEATDGTNTRQEDFFIVVTQDPRPEVNLGCVPNLNLTLEDDCTVEVVPEMVLSGTFGCLTADDFDITVVDGNPSNGAIVDGCGDFIYEVNIVPDEPTFGFTGDFSAGNWTLDINGDGSISFAPDGSTMTINSGDNFSFADLFVGAGIAMPLPGQLSFDWAYDGNDAGFDFFGYLIASDGTIITSFSTTNAASGSVNETVEAGDVLVLSISAPDQIQESEAVISNFAFAPSVNTDAEGFTTCWGYVHAEDKTKPKIVCPEDTDSAGFPATFQAWSGTLDSGDPTFHRPGIDFNGGGVCPTLSAFGTNVFYETFTFRVNVTDTYTFTNSYTGDAHAQIYAGSFDPDDPCDTWLTGNDDSAGGLDPLITISLTMDPGVYVLVTTTFGNGSTGNYNWTVLSAGNNNLITSLDGTSLTATPFTLFKELICEDIDQILIEGTETYYVDADGNTIPGTMSPSLAQKLDWTGRPLATDNCGDIRISVSDSVADGGDCGDVVITRTFYAEDKQNNDCAGAPNTAICTQIITVRKPTPADVVIPPFLVEIDCDEAYEVDANGNPAPSVTGFPQVVTAFDVVDLDQTYCNIGATYSDQPRITVCDDTYKVLREWTVLDWCTASGFQFFQFIKVGDNEGPIVQCPIEIDEDDLPGDDDVEFQELRYSTGPFDCTAAFLVPLPEVSDNCSGDWEVHTEIVTDIEVEDLNQYGQVIGTHTETIVVATIPDGAPRYVAGIPVGCHRFRYTVTDNCGNETVHECDFYVEDKTEPVAVCDDDLHISIGGQGYARVHAEDIDEGSWDNCGLIRIEVRRLVTKDAATCAPIPPFYTPWGPYVDFNCCDVNDLVRIEMRVWDDRNGDGRAGEDINGDGIPGDPIPVTLCDGSVELISDNSNVCWLDVLVEDKLRPYCIAPDEEDVNCGDLPYDFDPFNTAQLQDLFGEAAAADNCPGAVWEELTPIVNLHDCGFGTIIRRFRAIDAVGNTSTNTCQQLVTIREVHEYEIKFPKDASNQVCGTPLVDTLEFNEIGCDLLAVSVEDEFFSASGAECYKIFREYRVINWCEYDGISDPIVVSRDEDCDLNPGDEDVWVLVRQNYDSEGDAIEGSTTTYYDRDNDETNLNPLALTKGTSCDGMTNPTGYWMNSRPKTASNPWGDPSIASVGYWQYTQVIKVYDTIDPIISFDQPDPFCSLDNVDCDGPVEYPFTVDENCTPDDLTIKVFLDAGADGTINANVTSNLSGTYPDYTISGEFPIGSHAFEVHVEDGCGNVTSRLLPFQVVDCKAPTPVCINGLAIELMPVEPGTDADGDGDDDTGAMAIWAIDFIASPVYDCYGQGPQVNADGNPIVTKYSINRAGETPDRNQDGIVLTCDDPSTLIVEIYAWDNAFNPYAVQPDGSVGGPNYDFCETYVLVQDNMFGLCSGGVGSGSIAGIVTTEEVEAIADVEVSLSGQMNQQMMTPNNGAYLFSELLLNYDYTVTPLLDNNYLNGVSTFDLVLISKHILGIQPLNSPYKMIAADANNSKSITTLDIIQFRKLILGTATDLTNNTSWRFIDANYSFPQPANPWFEAFPEVININDLQGPITDADFMAVKIGDVNGSAWVNAMSVEDRNIAGTLAFQVADQALKAGNEYTVEFTAADIASIQGYQFTLNFDKAALELVDIIEGAATEDNFGLSFLNEGVITTSWNGQATAKQALFSLVFRATADANLSDLLSVSSRYTVAEAYDLSNEVLDVAINFSTGTVATAGFELYQNTPNPFKGETVIGFNLPEAANVSITIHDVTGKALKLIRGEFVKGYNQVTVNSSELPAVGVLYYTLETDDFTSTKKMIIVE